MSGTAGKGLGITFRAGNHSGAIRVSVPRHRSKAVVEILEAGGYSAELGLNADELRLLARTLTKIAAALVAGTSDEEITQH